MRLLKVVLILMLSSSIVICESHLALAATHKSSGHSKAKRYAAKKAGPGNVWDRIRAGIRIPKPNPSSGTYHFVQVRLPQALDANPFENTSSGEKNLPLTATENTAPPKETAILKHSSQLREKFRIRHVIAPQQNNQIVLETAPEANHKELDRHKLLKQSPEKQKQAEIAQSNDLIKAETTQINSETYDTPSRSRIRTKLNVVPQTVKQGAKAAISSQEKGKTNNPVVSTNTGPIKSCKDLSKQELIQQAELGTLTESYNQMVEQCRRKQSDNYARISKHINGYSSGYLSQVAHRAKPYLYHIVDTLSKYNVPLDIALLPIVESAFQATALSPKSAAGIWQFIPSTGREYGLEQDENYDGRLDPAASTLAAVRFLSGLNGHFGGDWLLTLAAYNSGQGTVDAAIARNRAEGLDTDFWSLDLPAETKEYVPRLLALSTIFANPGAYGLSLQTIRNEPYFIKVNIDEDIYIDQLLNKDLKTIAKLANCPSDEFLLLNAAYLNQTLLKRKSYGFLMPASSANYLHQNMAYVAWSNMQESSTKQPSPNPKKISLFERFNVEMPWLTLNRTQETIALFDKKPIEFKTAAKENDTHTKSSSNEFLVTHYVEIGETLKSLADAHGVSEIKLRELNKIKRKTGVIFGQKLLIPYRPLEVTTKKPHSSILFSDMTEKNSQELNLL